MPSQDWETEELLERVSQGDRTALDRLFARHRDRLRRMVEVRMDPRLASRVDPSDVVQEALAEASKQLPDYLRDRPLPFYPWLRQLAWERLVDLHRWHIHAKKRSVRREEPCGLALSDESVMKLAERLMDSGTSPSGRMVRQEVRQRVREAMKRLAAHDREVLVMRHLEQLQLSEIAAVLSITEAAVQSRYRRAAERLHRLLTVEFTEEQP